MPSLPPTFPWGGGRRFLSSNPSTHNSSPCACGGERCEGGAARQPIGSLSEDSYGGRGAKLLGVEQYCVSMRVLFEFLCGRSNSNIQISKRVSANGSNREKGAVVVPKCTVSGSLQ